MSSPVLELEISISPSFAVTSPSILALPLPVLVISMSPLFVLLTFPMRFKLSPAFAIVILSSELSVVFVMLAASVIFRCPLEFDI